MRLNPLAIGIGAVVLCAGGVYLTSGNGEVKNVSLQARTPTLPTIEDNESNDATSSEDVATLIAMSKMQEVKYAKLDDKYKIIKAQVEQQEKATDFDKESIVKSVISRMNTSGVLNVNKEVTDKMNELENQVRDFTGKDRLNHTDPNYVDDYGVDHSGTSIANSFNDGSTTNLQTNPVKLASTYTLGVEQEFKGWTLPSDGQLIVQNGNKDPKAEYALDKSEIFSRNTGSNLYKKAVVKLTESGEEEDQITKFGTIPQDSTLMGAVTMTALLGRIPVKGKLIDPFEFKVLVGAENLASNGIYIPNLKAMVLRGVAKGIYTGQCVAGDIISGTYTFNDGRIQSFTAADLNQSGSTSYAAAGEIVSDRVGWISTPTGIPCISGEYISDASSFIALQGGLAALGGISNGFAAAAQEVSGTGDNRSQAITDPTQYALGTGGDASVKSMSKWIEDIRQTAFAMVYVQPNQKVAVNITKAIPIDYHSLARKVSYANDWGNHEQNFD